MSPEASMPDVYSVAIYGKSATRWQALSSQARQGRSNMEALLTIEEVAAYLKVSKETVYKMAQRGEVPALKVGTQWRFERSAIEEWLRSRSNQSIHRRSKVKVQKQLNQD
jgi:excisionase family DNA binding protein